MLGAAALLAFPETVRSRLLPCLLSYATGTRLDPEKDFAFDLSGFAVPRGSTLAVIVNPNNPNGGAFDMEPLPGLLRAHPDTLFLVDEAFIGMAGQSVAHLVPRYANLLVTRTFSKAHSLAGFRVGYAIRPPAIADDLNTHNDAYPLARPSQAAAVATLQHEDKIQARVTQLQKWTADLATALRAMGVRTFPSATYFFLADFAPHDAETLAENLRQQKIFIKPLRDPMLGPGFMRVTTALPQDNARLLTALTALL